MFDNILTNIGHEGYTPGARYEIMTYIGHPLRNTFGFQLTAQNAAGDYAGSFFNLSGATQTLTSGRYITHVEPAISDSTQQVSWTFEWEAPANGFGDVTFFGAYNAANGDGASQGDSIYFSSITYSEKIQTTVPGHSGKNSFTKIYPNPAQDFFYISFADFNCNSVCIEFYDFGGKLIEQKFIGESDGATHFFSVQELQLGTGRYVVKIYACDSVKQVPLIVL